jgi:ribose-phosphate pyrophosphokinase
VVVAPDLGAVKLAERYAAILEAPVAVVQKTRLGPEEVRATSVIGDVRGKTAVIVDDMISTGGTIEAATNALLAAGSKGEFTVAATHGLFVGPCKERFASLPIARLLVTDSLCAALAGTRLETVSVAPLIAEAIVRVHRGQPVSGMLGPVI